MATELATAYVQIVPSADGIQGKITQALAPEADKAGIETGKKAGSSFVSSLGSALTTGAAVIGAAATTMVGSVIAGTKQLAEYGDNIDKMSQKFGISAQAYQEWDAVLQHSGTSIEAMKPAFKNLANLATENAAAFKDLGLSEKDVANMSTEELFAATITGLQNMEEGADRTALATSLLGKAGMEMGALLNTSSEDTQKMIETVNALGGVLSDDAVKDAAAFQDALQDMNTAMTGMKNQLMAQFMPSFTTIMNGLTEIFAGDTGKGVKLVKDGMVAIGQGIKDAIPKIFESGKQIVSTLLNLLVQALPDFLDIGIDLISSMVRGIGNNLPTIISKIVEVATKLLSALIKKLPDFIAAGVKLIGALITGIIKSIPQILSSIGTLCREAVSAFTKIDWAGVGKNMIDGVVRGLSAAKNKVKDFLTGIAKGALDAVKKFFGIKSPSTVFRDQVGKNMMLGLAEGLEDNENAVTSAINDINDLTMDGLNKDLNYNITAYKPSGFASGVNYGGVSININANDYNSAQDVAQAVKNMLVNDMTRQEAVFA